MANRAKSPTPHKGAPPSPGAKRNRDLREEAKALDLRQLSIMVPDREYRQLWKQLGAARTNIRLAIANERAFRARLAAQKAQGDDQLELPGVGGAL